MNSAPRSAAACRQGGWKSRDWRGGSAAYWGGGWRRGSRDWRSAPYGVGAVRASRRDSASRGAVGLVGLAVYAALFVGLYVAGTALLGLNVAGTLPSGGRDAVCEGCLAGSVAE